MSTNYKKISYLVASWIVFFAIGYSTPHFFNASEGMNAVWATFGSGQKVRKADVWPNLEQDVKQLELNSYTLKKRAITDYITQKLIDQAVKDAGLSNRQELLQSMKSRESISSEEYESRFERFLQQRELKKEALSQAELSNAKANFDIELQQENNQNLIADIYNKGQVRVQIPPPFDTILEIDKGLFPARGKNQNGIPIIYVANFHCPFCTNANQRALDLMDKYNDRISIFFRFRVDEAKDSINFRTAEAALCAQEQNLFWPFYQLVSTSPPRNEEALFSLGQEAKLDIEKLKKCLENGKTSKALLKENEDLKSKGINDLPSFVIQGRLLKGVPSLESASDLIEFSEN
jgi:protein-disulfide isomerase